MNFSMRKMRGVFFIPKKYALKFIFFIIIYKMKRLRKTKNNLLSFSNNFIYEKDREDIRKKMIDKIISSFGYHINRDSLIYKNIVDDIIIIENNMYNKSNEEYNAYITKIVHFIDNITSGEYGFNFVYRRYISKESLDLLTSDFLMMTKDNKDIIAEIFNSSSTKENLKGFTMFKCRNCGESNSRMDSIQNRCADEAATTLITCLNCGRKFKL